MPRERYFADYNTMEYFFKNIDLFLKNSREILCYNQLRNIQIQGMYYKGKLMTIGQAIRFYNKPKTFRIVKKEESDILYVFNFRIATMPPAGPQGYAWSVKKQDFVRFGSECYEEGFLQVPMKYEKKPFKKYHSSKISEVPEYLKTLFAPLLQKQKEFLKIREEEEIKFDRKHGRSCYFDLNKINAKYNNEIPKEITALIDGLDNRVIPKVMAPVISALIDENIYFAWDVFSNNKKLKYFDLNMPLQEEKKTVLMYYVTFCENLEILKLLLKGGADINAKDNNGETALSIAQKIGNEEIIAILKG